MPMICEPLFSFVITTKAWENSSLSTLESIKKTASNENARVMNSKSKGTNVPFLQASD